MIDITIKIIGLGIGSRAQGIVFLNNSKNELLYVKETYNGMVKFSLIPNNLYKLYIISNQGRKCISFYVDNKRDYYCFNLFDKNYRRIITFRLTDANYENLPIKKGEIILWLK